LVGLTHATNMDVSTQQNTMSNFIPIDSDLIAIVAPDSERLDIAPAITSLYVSLTMDGASEITFEVIDQGFTFAKANYFNLRRDVIYDGMLFEISAVEVERSDGFAPKYTISARSKAVQRMKRDKGAESFSGLTVTQFAQTIASRFSMGFFGQETSKQQSIVKGKSARVDESTWDVLTRVANDNQFVVFETSNILFFTSQEYLAGKWGDPDYIYQGNTIIPFGWPETDDATFPGAREKWILIDMPNLRRSDDNPLDAEGSMQVERINGRKLRPGMTINLTGIPEFEGIYLITAVEFQEGVSDPVSVSFRIPSDPEAPAGQGGNGYNSGISGSNDPSLLPADIMAKISDFMTVSLGYDEAGIPYAQHYADFATKEIAAYNSALLVWQERTEEGKDEKLLEIQGSLVGGGLNLIYRALLAVKTDLYRNVLNSQERALSSELKSVLRQKVRQHVGFASGAIFQQLYNVVSRDARQLWEATSINQQGAIFREKRAKYGANDFRYTVLQDPDVVRLVRYEMPNLLRVNIPEGYGVQSSGQFN